MILWILDISLTFKEKKILSRAVLLDRKQRVKEFNHEDLKKSKLLDFIGSK